MYNRIPEDFIEEVRRQADIVQIISEHVVLKRTGKNYQGLCPFHSEKTPSFNVNPERQMFYCFGCHTGGNVFTFLMKKENLAFIDAVRTVAERTGIAFPEKELSPTQRKTELKRKRFLEIHKLAANYFHEVLLNSPEGQPGRQYLKARGIGAQTISDFALGYAPEKWDGLLKYMASKSVSPEELVEFGLAVGKTANDGRQNYYDRFRGRIIFTIKNLRGSPIAFGGRVLDNSLPKYLNSPETDFFHKGRNLYAIHLANRVIREEGSTLLLEGYMDTIAVHRAGLKNAVASLGTAFTRNQAKMLKRYARKVIIGYDSDSAGIQATLRAGDILLEEGLQVEVLVLDEAKDPDEFLSKYSVEEFRKKIKNAISLFEFKYKTLVKDLPPRTIQDKAEIIRKLAPDILKTASAVEKEGYEKFLSQELGLSWDAVKYEINSLAKKYQKDKAFSKKSLNTQDIYVKNRNNIKGIESTYPMHSFVPLGVFRAEQIILRIILENPDKKGIVSENLGNDFWRLKEHKYIFENYPEKSASLSQSNDSWSDSWYVEVQKRLAAIYEIDIDTGKAEILLKDCISSIKTSFEKESVEELQAKMINLEKSGDMTGALRILQEIGERLKRGEK
ncbi:MAG: DNA primase [Peptococcaceae bacterium]|nr:DNA primase [Peptococcaceae bacterium]